MGLYICLHFLVCLQFYWCLNVKVTLEEKCVLLTSSSTQIMTVVLDIATLFICQNEEWEFLGEKISIRLLILMFELVLFHECENSCGGNRWYMLVYYILWKSAPIFSGSCLSLKVALFKANQALYDFCDLSFTTVVSIM